MDRRIRLLAISILISCAGCVHTEAARRTFDLTPAKTSQEAYERLEEGMTREEAEQILGEEGRMGFNYGGATIPPPVWNYDNFELQLCFGYENRQLTGHSRRNVTHGPSPKWWVPPYMQAMAATVGTTAILEARFHSTTPMSPIQSFAELQSRLRGGMTGEELDQALGIRPDVVVKVTGIGYERYYYALEARLTSDEFDELQVFRKVWQKEMPGQSCLSDLKCFMPGDYISAAGLLKVGMSVKQVERRLGASEFEIPMGPFGTFCLWTNLSCALTFTADGLRSWHCAR